MSGLVLFKMHNTEFDYTKRFFYSIIQLTIMIAASYFVILLINKPSWFINMLILALYLFLLVQAFYDNKWHIDEVIIYEHEAHFKIRRFNKIVFNKLIGKSDIACSIIKSVSGSGTQYEMLVNIKDFGNFKQQNGKVWSKEMFEEVIKALNNSQVTSVI